MTSRTAGIALLAVCILFMIGASVAAHFRRFPIPTDPLEQLDIVELYDAFTNQEMIWGEGMGLALATLADGRAWAKFEAICRMQGGLRTPPKASHVYALVAPIAGRVVHINNRKLARLAKLAGAPDIKQAGVLMKARLGEDVDRGQPLMEVHAASAAELAYALDYAARAGDIVLVEP